MEIREKVNQVSVSEGVNSLKVSSQPFSLSEREAEFKFPSNREVEKFVNSFLVQKERNEMRGEEFPLNIFVDWTSNKVKLFVSNPKSVFADISFKIWTQLAKETGGN
jgi:flagellar assembly factor FliW